MNKQDICNFLKKVTVPILLENPINTMRLLGTGVIIDKYGSILTAKHVIADKKEGIVNGNIFVNHTNTGVGMIKYKNVLGHDFSIGLPDIQGVSMEPLDIDLMILVPEIQVMHDFEYIDFLDGVLVEGEDVIIGGYSDDIELPFNFLDNIKILDEEAQDKKDFYFKALFRQVLFKSGMIGRSTKINFSFNAKPILGIDKEISGVAADYWIDNNITYGGSGGPIVNLDCKLAGIMTEKALTKDFSNNGKKTMPSGTGRGLSHQLITWIMESLHK